MRSTTGHGSMPAYGIPLPLPADQPGVPSMLLLDHGDWRDDAECAREDDTWWFARPASRRHRQAVLICQDCPVRRLCLAVSLVYAEEFGVWGGVSAHHRAKLVVQLRDGTPLVDLLDTADATATARPERPGEVPASAPSSGSAA